MRQERQFAVNWIIKRSGLSHTADLEFLPDFPI